MTTTPIVLDNGIYLPEADLWLDARRRRSSSVVSHAHTDHWARHEMLIATPATLDLLRLRWPKAPGYALPYGRPLEREGCRLTLFPAGHCLGSAQVLVEMHRGEERVVYTGDFKLAPNVAAEPAPVIPCDTLVIDATYGHPRYRFPPTEETMSEVFTAMDACLSGGCLPVIIAYAVGKAQEVLKLLVDRGYRVIADPVICRGASVYEDHGVRLGSVCEAHPGDDLCSAVVIVSRPALAEQFARERGRVKKIRLTGWAVDRWRSSWWGDDLAFPFSDHADFDELLRYAQMAAPQRIFTIGSFPHLAKELCRRGLNAWHLAEGCAPFL